MAFEPFLALLTPFGAILSLIGGYTGPFLDHFGVVLASFWLVLVSFCQHFGAFLGYFWTILAHFYGHFAGFFFGVMFCEVDKMGRQNDAREGKIYVNSCQNSPKNMQNCAKRSLFFGYNTLVLLKNG